MKAAKLSAEIVLVLKKISVFVFIKCAAQVLLQNFPFQRVNMSKWRLRASLSLVNTAILPASRQEKEIELHSSQASKHQLVQQKLQHTQAKPACAKWLCPSALT